MTITKKQFINACKYLRLKSVVTNSRLCLSGNIPNEIREALADSPELEAELILHKAIHDADLLDSIQERACIRWVEGFSDSLFDAVLSSIKPLHETVEYSNEIDESKIEFLHKMGFSDEEIKSKGMGRNVILKPRTDWEAELKKYE